MNIDLNAIYNEFVNYYKPLSPEALGWHDYEGQQKRFKVILQGGITSEDSVLDVGCGYGDFSLMFGENYLGIDLRQEAIDGARKKYPARKFEIGDIDRIGEQYDWVVASGIFCFQEDKWEEYVQKALQNMFNVSNKGVAVNFLSCIHYFDDPSREEDGGLKYAMPEDVMRLIRVITNNFIIRHDYGLKDFTLYLYKEENF